ncbi:Uncharacterised protein [Escherichia coli]|nr:Uncharacterised protein [Escherichia coli]CTW39755.1 Uncharacterised protein [Escherichia coli]CTX22276.1 Uncharacterised protein [Escherichia coli]CTY25522.1 Uncharacterised protein [Escherichia coli]
MNDWMKEECICFISRDVKKLLVKITRQPYLRGLLERLLGSHRGLEG